jgi:uncharacterized protein (DUF1501 family)
MLCLHYDDKLVKQMEGDLSIKYSTVERVAVSVTSPDVGNNNNIHVVALTESPKGSDQARVILSLLDYYEVVDQIFAICCDTSLNTAFLVPSVF